MSAGYDCSICGNSYNDLEPAMNCCALSKAQITGLTANAYTSIYSEIEREVSAQIGSWIRMHDPVLADSFDAGEWKA